MSFSKKFMAKSPFNSSNDAKGWYHSCGPKGGCTPYPEAHQKAHDEGRMHDAPPDVKPSDEKKPYKPSPAKHKRRKPHCHAGKRKRIKGKIKTRTKGGPGIPGMADSGGACPSDMA
tara:strand:- start:88 stop:435 length:348 start_codon:yes stop_codon:yes gene_type:complete